MHLYDKHDGDPDDGADDHEPAQNHGPGGVSVVLVGHHLPLVEAQYQDALGRGEHGGKAGEPKRAYPVGLRLRLLRKTFF